MPFLGVVSLILVSFILFELGASIPQNSRTSNSSSSTTADESSAVVGSYILQGLGSSASSSSSLSACPSTAYTGPWTLGPNATAITVRPTGNGLEYAQQCAEIGQWWSSSSSSNWMESDITQNNTYTTIGTNYSAAIITLCDGFPRVSGHLTPTATVTYTTSSLTSIYPVPPPTCSVDPSDCAYLWSAYTTATNEFNSRTESDDAAETIITFDSWSIALTIFSGYSTLTSSIITAPAQGTPPVMTLNETTYTEDNGTYTILGHKLTAGGQISVFPRCYSPAYLPFEPNCTTTVDFHTTAIYNKSCGACTIYGGEVKLMYFPVTVNTSINICSASTRPITVCPFGPTTAPFKSVDSPYDPDPCNYAPINETLPPDSGPYAVINSSTFWANKAYLSLATAYASGSCGYVGAQHTSTILALKSSDIYSVGGYHYQFLDAAFSFDFNDLNTPIPAIAYPWFVEGGPCTAPAQDWDWPNAVDGSRGEAIGPCSTIVQDLVSPTLAVPPQLRSIDPQWAQCALNLVGLYDPPQALTQYAVAAGPAAPHTTTATLKPGPTAQPVTGPTTTAESPPPAPPTLPTEGPGPGKPTPTGDPGFGEPAPTISAGAGGSGDPGSGLHLGTGSSGIGGPGSGSSGNGGNAGSSSDPRSSHPGEGISSTIAGGGGNSNLGGGIASIIAGGGRKSGSSLGIGGSSSSGADPESDNPGTSGNVGSHFSPSAAGSGAGSNAGGGIASILGGSSQNSGLGSVSGSSGASGNPGSGLSSSGSGAGAGVGAGAGSSSGSSSGRSASDSALSSAGTSSGPQASGSLVSTGSGSGSGSGASKPGSSATGSGEGLGSGSSSSSRYGSSGLGNGGGGGAGQIGAVFSAGGRAFTATPVPSSNGRVVVGGQAVSPGGGAATLPDGQVVSAAPSGVVVGSPGSPGSTIVFSNIGSEPGAGAGTAASIGAVFTTGGQIFTADSSGSAVVVDSQTLKVDGVAKTLPDGQVISAVSAGLVVGTGAGATTAAFSSILSAESAEPSSEAVLTLGGAAVTASEGPSGIVVIDGHTLSSGGSAITIDGTVLSAAKSGINIGGTNGHNTTADFFTAPTESPGNNGSPATATKSGVPCLRARSYVGAFVVVFVGLMMVF